MALGQSSIRSQQEDCDVIMVKGIPSLLRVSMVKCALLSCAGCCVVGTSFGGIWLETCISEVVMQAKALSLFLYSNQIWFNRNIIKEYSIDFRQIHVGNLHCYRQYVYVCICNRLVNASLDKRQSAPGPGTEGLARGPKLLMWLDDRFGVKYSSPHSRSDTLLAA